MASPNKRFNKVNPEDRISQLETAGTEREARLLERIAALEAAKAERDEQWGGMTGRLDALESPVSDVETWASTNIDPRQRDQWDALSPEDQYKHYEIGSQQGQRPPTPQAGKGYRAIGQRVQPGGGQLPPNRQWAEEMRYGVDYGPVGGGFNWKENDAYMGREDAPPPTPEEVEAFRNKTLQHEAKARPHRQAGKGDGQRIRPVPNRPDDRMLEQAGALRGVPQYGPDPETLNALKQSYGGWPTIHPSMGYQHKRTPPSYQVLGPPPGSQMGRPQFGGFNQPMRQPQYGMGGMGMMPMGGMNPGVMGGGFAPSYNRFQQQYGGGMPGGGIGSFQPQQFNTFGRGGMGGMM